MLQVKFDGQITIPTFTGTTETLAVVDAAGNRYALLQQTQSGKLSAWSGDVNENSVPCVIVQEFPGAPEPVLTGRESLLEELSIVGDIRQGRAVLTVDAEGFHMRDSQNILGRHRHDLPIDTSADRLEAHWAGFVENVRGK